MVRRRRKSPVMALLHFIMERSQKRTDDHIRIRIPLHIFASLPIQRTKMSSNGRKHGQGNYGRVETVHLLNILQRILPIGSEEWQQCLDEHNLEYPGRCKQSIMRKYAGLYRKGTPTGDPNCPDNVKLAKRVKYAIGNRAAIGDGEEQYVVETNGFIGNQPIPHGMIDDSDDDSDNDNDDDNMPTLPPVQARPPAPKPARKLTPAKRSYRGKDEAKQDFLQLYQMNMLAQQQERENDRKERAEERRNDRNQMMALMMAMVSGRQAPSQVPSEAPYPRLADDSDDSSDDSDLDLHLDNISEPSAPKLAVAKRDAPVAVGVLTRHKKKKGLGNSSTSER